MLQSEFGWPSVRQEFIKAPDLTEIRGFLFGCGARAPTKSGKRFAGITHAESLRGRLLERHVRARAKQPGRAQCRQEQRAEQWNGADGLVAQVVERIGGFVQDPAAQSGLGDGVLREAQGGIHVRHVFEKEILAPAEQGPQFVVAQPVHEVGVRVGHGSRAPLGHGP